ncbi:MAG: hypothetical protein AAGF71_07180 [Pseudomonadota bacterium]
MPAPTNVKRQAKVHVLGATLVCAGPQVSDMAVAHVLDVLAHAQAHAAREASSITDTRRWHAHHSAVLTRAKWDVSPLDWDTHMPEALSFRVTDTLSDNSLLGLTLAHMGTDQRHVTVRQSLSQSMVDGSCAHGMLVNCTAMATGVHVTMMVMHVIGSKPLSDVVFQNLPTVGTTLRVGVQTAIVPERVIDKADSGASYSLTFLLDFP